MAKLNIQVKYDDLSIDTSNDAQKAILKIANIVGIPTGGSTGSVDPNGQTRILKIFNTKGDQIW